MSTATSFWCGSRKPQLISTLIRGLCSGPAPSRNSRKRTTTGQNGLIQAKQFKEAAGITGIVLTKLDGSAKGGIVIAIAQELQVPVKFIGVGEGIDDLMPFEAEKFVEALV